jgi:phosphate transport system substrate-binding protein
MKKYLKFINCFFLIAGFIFFILLTSCGGNSGQKEMDTPTAGSIRVGIDDSYRLLLEAEIYTFESLYIHAHINPVYKGEVDVINDFINDSMPLIIVNRKLTEKQEKYLNSIQYVARTTVIAKDALALIVNRENTDTTLFYEQVRDILLGKVTQWKQMDPISDLKEIKVVFDNLNSGNPRYFKEKFAIDSFPHNCFAAKDNAEVINYVEKNKGAIGIISVNWISDKQDTVSNKFLQRIKVAGVAIEGDNNPDTKFYRPFPGYIAEGSYPFIREVYCINRQPYKGMAFGFSSFIAGEKGQMIVLHSGLVPAAMPVRLVEIRK